MIAGSLLHGSRLGIIALFCGVLGACTTLEGVKLEASGAMPKGHTYGIPYMLTRPEFVVKDDGSGKYSVQPVYVPDPEQRYTLRMSPATFADIDFSLVLNATGGIASVEGKTTDKVQPTAKAFLDLALKGATWTLAEKEGSPKIECASSETPASHALCALEKPSSACSSTALASIKARLAAFVDDKDPKKDKRDFASAFFYVGNDEKECLAAQGKRWKGYVETYLAAWKAIALSLPKDTDPQVRFKARIVAILEGADARGARRLVRAVEVAGNKAITSDVKRMRRLRRELGLPDHSMFDAKWFEKCGWQADLARVGFAQPVKGCAAGVGDKLKGLDKVFDDIKTFDLGHTNADRTDEPRDSVPSKLPIVIATTALRTAIAFSAIANASADVWRSRRLARYDEEIAELKFQLQQQLSTQHSSATKTSSDLAKMEKDRAQFLLLAREYDRLGNLERRALPPRALQARQSAMEEYRKERSEIESLRASISARAETVAAAGKAKDATPQLNLIAERSYPACIAASREPEWPDADTAPDFVVVLRPLSGAPAPGEPTYLEECP